MARIRTLKPEFWQDEKLLPLSDTVRLVFLGLISMADDFGRMVYNAKLIEAQLFDPDGPDRSRDLREALATLRELGRIATGRVASGQRVLQIVNWEKHQKVDRPNVGAALPAIVDYDPIEPANDSRMIRERLANRSGEVQETDPERPEQEDRRAPTGAVDGSGSVTPQAVETQEVAAFANDSRMIREPFANDSRPIPVPVPVPTINDLGPASSEQRAASKDAERLIEMATNPDGPVSENSQNHRSLLAAAANRGILEKLGKQHARIPEGSAKSLTVELAAKGVPIRFALTCVYARAAALEKPVHSMGYFTAYVVEAWEREQALSDAAQFTPPAVRDRSLSLAKSDERHRLELSVAFQRALEYARADDPDALVEVMCYARQGEPDAIQALEEFDSDRRERAIAKVVRSAWTGESVSMRQLDALGVKWRERAAAESTEAATTPETPRIAAAVLPFTKYCEREGIPHSAPPLAAAGGMRP